MKISLGVFAFLLLAGFGSTAQTTPKHATHAAKPAHEEYMVMKGGKMMMMHGKLSPMTMDMTMSDGTICMTNGTCKAKDGTITKMKDGDHCMIKDGKMMVHPGTDKKP
ncbi:MULTISPECIES: DUF6799 domain-containing protein [Spirosoma]|uniref:DUF6799 domain-containing protein n=1 Tax=Spirosoma linguale (strain ATCC 33905 / DSM 74 / LMG 10896 / Claus 1) TaxID=504472 RepID=D2QVK9_SPILD|nr:DUF6799 domain-containing protein [Spirosoma sp. 209]ADB42841.1 hypothetical protein Slin_6894 [Spirosoma linguale DSM 74]